MKAGNKIYSNVNQLPDTVPVFPLSGALLLPGSQLPLNIFEPRYLEMIEAAMAAERLIGIIQPDFNDENPDLNTPALCNVGCLGRIVSFQESGDGRLGISLHGVARFRVAKELDVNTAYRQCEIIPFAGDLERSNDGDEVDRESLLNTFRAYLEANELDADWESVNKASNEGLVNALSVMSPYGAAEKQALLEAPDLKSRAATLVAITEMALARGNDGDEYARTLQ